ncbi:hypothetical protein PIB30_064382 [Stylosanthes scabra]|uniref:RNase H type-1 domain-containing protein n=1 Tax=Stylosanthes scabra TaxID=79078 RepID=A0ABU6QME2_9FABA|nr:hypothetical protein [Stylosanthes scabra]
MGKMKAPDPDGVNGLFYQQHWISLEMRYVRQLEIFKKYGATVFRDNAGILFTASTINKVYYSPLATEAMAMRGAIIIAKNLQIEKILFESDFSNLIRKLPSDFCKKIDGSKDFYGGYVVDENWFPFDFKSPTVIYVGFI